MKRHNWRSLMLCLSVWLSVCLSVVINSKKQLGKSKRNNAHTQSTLGAVVDVVLCRASLYLYRLNAREQNVGTSVHSTGYHGTRYRHHLQTLTRLFISSKPCVSLVLSIIILIILIVNSIRSLVTSINNNKNLNDTQ